jgi:hypothetical protein
MRGRGGAPRGAAAAAAPPARRAAGGRVRRGDLYEADEGTDTRARRADSLAAPDRAAAALNELPEDLDDEEIDEDGAFTAEDQARWGDLDFGAAGGRGDDSGEDEEDDEEIEWEDGVGDPWAGIEDDAPAAAPAAGRRKQARGGRAARVCSRRGSGTRVGLHNAAQRTLRLATARTALTCGVCVCVSVHRRRPLLTWTTSWAAATTTRTDSMTMTTKMTTLTARASLMRKARTAPGGATR